MEEEEGYEIVLAVRKMDDYGYCDVRVVHVCDGYPQDVFNQLQAYIKQDLMDITGEDD